MVTTVGDFFSTFVSVTPFDLFKEILLQFTAVFVATKTEKCDLFITLTKEILCLNLSNP